MTSHTTTQSAEAGRRGEDVRSDCWVRIAPADSGGIELDLKSKVESMYGESIRKLIADGLAALGVSNAKVDVQDSGALPFVMMARLECAVRRLRGGGNVPTGSGSAQAEACDSLSESKGVDARGSSVEFLPDWAADTQYGTERERFRRSRLYLPGNEPKFVLNAGLYESDAVILDLEDSVPASDKDAARLLVRNALRCVDFKGAERMVRINQGELGLHDLDAIVPHNVHLILIPKVECAQQVQRVDARIQEIQRSAGVSLRSATDAGDSQFPNRPVYLMPIVESALGVIRAYDIATSSSNICALTIGLEDYAADIGCERTNEGWESFWARSQVVNAARAAGVQPIDSVFADVVDMDGLRKSALQAKALGFEGKGCVHPRQIAVVNEAFAPTEDELNQAGQIVSAFEEAQKKGLAVVSLGSKMIDPPIVKRALRVMKLARGLDK